MAIRNMTRCAFFAALLAICGWISVPLGAVTISMQSLGVLLALGTLGGRRGSIAVAVYLSLGAVGLPVFAGFRGGFGILLGPTGGYLWGFLLGGILYWCLERLLPRWLNFLLAQLLCYACGTAWYLMAFGGSFFPVLGLCVLPYLLPDGIKLVFSLWLSRKLERFA